MGRAPCCDEAGLKKGPWTPEEDKLLVEYVEKHGNGSWRRVPKLAGLNRCGKSCRLRWTNYLRPGIKRGRFSKEEEKLIIHLHSVVGNKWSSIAARLPGRTDNEIKNYWNTHMRKKLLNMGVDPVTHKLRADLNLLASIPNLLVAANAGNIRSQLDNALKLQADAANLAKMQLLQGLLQVLTSSAATAPTTTNLDLISSLMGSPKTSLWNKQLSDLLQFRSQYEGMLNTNSNLSSLAFINPLNNFLDGDDAVATTLVEGSCSSDQLGLESINDANTTNNIYTPLTSNSTPSLVSASPANCGRHDPINSGDGSIGDSPTSATPFDCWESLNLDDLNTDLGWKDMLKQISWLNTP